MFRRGTIRSPASFAALLGRFFASLLMLAPGTAAVRPTVHQVGLETLEADADAPLAGKRLGLVVHAASVTADGRHAVDVVRGLGLDVVRLFSPEHGLTGRAAAGEQFSRGRDIASGFPVFSLYGERRKPAPADLAAR